MYARILLIAWACIMTIAFLLYSHELGSRPVAVDEEKEVAFQECLEEIKNNCGSVISYAVALEAENARLNAAMKEMKNKCTVIH